MMNSIDIKKIEKKALEHRKMKDLGIDGPIGNKIFDILEYQYESILFLYPLKSVNICGFTRVKGTDVQVFINTTLSKNMQNFVGAHELYHIIESTEKKLTDKFIICDSKDVSENMSENEISDEELNANYFAASYLLPRQVVLERFRNLDMKKTSEEDLILEIIKIQFQYEVPFKTIIKRLRELDIVSDVEYGKLTGYENMSIDYCKMLDRTVCEKIIEQEKPDKRLYHTLNVSKMASDLYKNSALTFGKLEQILKKYDKNPGDFNILEEEPMSVELDFSKYGTGDENDEDED